MNKVKVYTDGACLGNPGPGGWAWAVSKELFDSGSQEDSTNQRMELTAALRAMEHFVDKELLVVSDSQYLVRCFNDGWWKKWVRNNWKNSQNQAVKNQDLWSQLITLYSNAPVGSIEFEWVKGHSGVVLNEYVDMLATGQAKSIA